MKDISRCRHVCHNDIMVVVGSVRVATWVGKGSRVQGKDYDTISISSSSSSVHP